MPNETISNQCVSGRLIAENRAFVKRFGSKIRHVWYLSAGESWRRRCLVVPGRPGVFSMPCISNWPRHPLYVAYVVGAIVFELLPVSDNLVLPLLHVSRDLGRQRTVMSTDCGDYWSPEQTDRQSSCVAEERRKI